MSNWFTGLFARAPAPEASKAPAEAGAKGAARVDTAVVSIDRAMFGVVSSGFPRVNEDELIRKKGTQVYARMRTDEQVKAAVTFKRDAILSRGWTFEWDSDSKLPDAEKDRRKRVFEQIVRKYPGSFVDALNVISVGREYGFSLTEKVYAPIEVDDRQYVGLRGLFGRDPATFNFYTDEHGDLERCEQEAGGRRIPIDLAKFVHYVHNPEFDRWFGRSDLREAYRLWYCKDMVLRFWPLFLERFGSGFLIAQLSADAGISPGTSAYQDLQSALTQAKVGAGIVSPVGVEFKLEHPATTDAFEKACTWFDLGIAKALLVPNLAGVSHTGSTGAYSQAQTQIEAFAWTLKTDSDRLQACVDEQLFRDLGDQNFGDGEYPCFKFKPLSGEMLRWTVDTWVKLAAAGTVVPTEVDEARLREILEMPPREEGDEPLMDPEAEAGRAHQSSEREAQFGQSQEAKDNDKDRNFRDDKRRARDPVLGAGEAEEREEYRRRHVEVFGFDPDQPRDEAGRWSNGAGTPGPGPSNKAIGRAEAVVEKVYDEGRYNKVYRAKNHTGESEQRAKFLEARQAISHSLKEEGYSIVSRQGDPTNGTTAYRDEHGNEVRVSTRSRPADDRLRSTETTRRNYSEFVLDVAYSPKGQMRRFTITREQARAAMASARERVDFVVVDKKQADMSAELTGGLAHIVARSVQRELGTDEDVARLTDEDTADIGQWQLSGASVGKLKVTTQKALADSWALGRQTAQSEIRRTSRKFARGLFEFADLRDKAASYFESAAFKVAGDVSDRARSIIQQELLNSVKTGRSPGQTRTAIWDRLVNRGLTSPEAVRSLGLDAAVSSALDELWKDTEEAAAAYLDTVARTNLFTAMNEARYSEFTDPALGDFVVALRYSAILDDRTTEICEALHDHVWAADSPLWDEYRPPNHFNCRSLLVPITQLDVEDGLWDGQESDEPTVEPQEGFGA